jgi:hypothetical protein
LPRPPPPLVWTDKQAPARHGRESSKAKPRQAGEATPPPNLKKIHLCKKSKL